MYSTDLLLAQAWSHVAWAAPVGPIKEDGPGVPQPLQAVELLDLRLVDRAAGREVDILERGAERELRGLDAVADLALLAIIGFGLQQRIAELAEAGVDTPENATHLT